MKILSSSNPLLGTWKLKSYSRELSGTAERYAPLGDHPNGYLSYSRDGRMYGILTAGNRIKPNEGVLTDEERINLHRTMVAYAGTYTLEPGKVVHHVDISWNEALTGTDQIRFYTLKAKILTIKSAPYRSRLDGREGVDLLVWEKMEASEAA